MTQVIGDKVSPCFIPLLTKKGSVGPEGVLIDVSLLEKRLMISCVNFSGQLILWNDLCMAGIGTESKALAISKEANQNSLLSMFAA